MKAIRIHKYGGPEVLQYEEAPRPKVAAANDVLIRVHAAEVNPTDWKVREGRKGITKVITAIFWALIICRRHRRRFARQPSVY
jgi:NADPH:quinone reductase-like Zn-dependent oxidoreductase